MLVPVNYLLVILIWATTPMAIKLSNDSLSPEASILLRMVLATLLMLLFIGLWQRHAFLKRQNVAVYLAGSIGLFPNMAIVYQAANHISSGMIAVMFALTPMVTGLLAVLLLKEEHFGWRKSLAILLALAGVALIFSDQLSLTGDALKGIMLMLCSVFLFSLSQVAVKYFQQSRIVDAKEQTLGAMMFAMPGLLASWLYFDGSLPRVLSQTTLYSVVYLALIGSVLGFVAYYFILSQLSVTTVSLIPMITPVLALWLGALLLHEQVGNRLMLGTLLIIGGLLCFQQWPRRKSVLA